MSDTIMVINTMRIRDGELEEFRESVRKAVEFAEEHAPQLLVQVYIDEHAMLAQSFQIYPDSAAILRHWQLSDPYIQDVSQHMTPVRLDVYGQPSDEVLDGLRPFQEAGTEVTVTPRLVGFGRFRDG